MANEITRDGITYRVSRSFTFDEDGEIHEHEGGEILDSDIDSILEAEQQARELDGIEAELDKEEAEWEADQKIKLTGKLITI